MIRRPPRSTLFPYTTSSDLLNDTTFINPTNFETYPSLINTDRDGNGSRRSEEHTSELQSHHDLVCRLLLEKNNIQHHREHSPKCRCRQRDHHHLARRSHGLH